MIEWSDPPENTRSGTWGETAEILKSKPNKWALIDTREATNNARAFVDTIRKGRTSTWEPPGSFEAKSAPLDDDSIGIWARYIGS
jgi:hypothetical protein